MTRDVENSLVVPVAEAEAHLDDLLKAVGEGETVVLTRNGRPVATLIPPRTQAPGEPEKKGLASLAGGWEGSDELADLVEEIRAARRS